MGRQDTRESFIMALATLRAHKFRSFLTVLGVVVGTVTVMVIASFIAGLDQKFKNDIESFGTNAIFIYKFNPGIHVGRLTPEERMRKPITYEDAMAIKEQCPSVKYIVPFLGADNDIPRVRYQDQELYVTQVQGTLPEYERMTTVHIGEGRFFTESENDHRADVCVIGADIADKFFPNLTAVGKEILVNDKPLKVIGVFEKLDNFFIGENDGGNQNRAVYLPYETMRKMYPQEKDHFVMAQAQEGKMDKAIEEVRTVLRRRREVPFDKDDNFGLSTPDAITEQFHQITGGIAILMVAISSVGLLIGGIGVMNIMLVSVTERTKEIGVRKAIGARKRDILRQFLIEAMALTGSGGLLGIFIGWLLSLLVNLILPVYVPAWAPIVGISVSAGIGLIFGMWPAMKASRLDPIDALRYE
ncbi:MAG TPA: ABC transporter permease [Blastocatellia bacterium]|nr:ABC transporter permease [Blastocatellia bacterium]